MSSPLRLVVSIGAGESPTSFASRLAARNGCPTVRHFCLDMGVLFQDIVNGQVPALERLAMRGAADPTEVCRHAISETGDGFALRQERLTQHSLRRHRVFVCPACFLRDLEEGQGPSETRPYGRILWELATIRTCSEHRLGLIQVPATSKSGGHDFAKVAAAAVPRLDELVRTAPERGPSRLEHYLIGRLQDEATTSPWLDCMPFYAAARLTEIVGAVALFGPKVKVFQLSQSQWHEAGDAGFAITSEGEVGFRRFLAGLQTAFRLSKGDWGPRLLFGRLYDWLAHETEDPAYDHVREVIRQHVIETMPVGPGDHIFSIPVEARRVHSIRSAAQEAGAHPKRLRKLLHAAGYIREADMTLSDERVTFPVAEVKDYLGRIANSMSLEAAGHYLNAPRVQIDLLFKAGFIRPFAGGATGAMDYAFAKRDLDEFLARLFANAPSVYDGVPGFFTIPKAAKRACCSASEIVAMILNGSLTRVGRRRGGRGYLSVLVDLQEVRSWVCGEDHGGLSLRAVEKIMSSSTRVVKALTELGYLPSEVAINPVNRTPQRIVLPAELNKFLASFVLLQSLAAERGIHFLHLKKSLENDGVRPAFDPDLARASFYRRSDLPFD